VPTSSAGTTAVPTNGVKKMAKSISLRETTGNGVNRTKIKKKKVIVIGDSHARGLAVELLASLGKNFEVMGSIMPGSGLRHIAGLTIRETRQLQQDEFVIICGGANDINKNEPNIGLRNIRNFALQNKHTNIITISPPNRHDLQDSTCIYGERQIYNRKLHKILKDMYHVTITDTNYTREDFTQHGLHMNLAGKEKLARTIGHVITNFFAKQTSSISLNWKEASTATTTKDATVDSCTGNAEAEHKTEIRASNRVKKIPATRNEDFLWPTHTSKTI
jgi:lysophospholipase L1-like esterase